MRSAWWSSDEQSTAMAPLSYRATWALQSSRGELLGWREPRVAFLKCSQTDIGRDHIAGLPSSSCEQRVDSCMCAASAYHVSATYPEESERCAKCAPAIAKYLRQGISLLRSAGPAGNAGHATADLQQCAWGCGGGRQRVWPTWMARTYVKLCMHAKTLLLACTFPWPVALQQACKLGEARRHVSEEAWPKPSEGPV
jgi:hypothetical protein